MNQTNRVKFDCSMPVFEGEVIDIDNSEIESLTSMPTLITERVYSKNWICKLKNRLLG